MLPGRVEGVDRMKIGIAMFPTIDAPAPGRLGQMIEDRGLESLWFAEHSHLPVGIYRAAVGDGGYR
jgi:alkanesulfonate monooxygenase SsuD/methylene tetrahydromethanopterin reductase-like flavin-dependent oxidoreductase (luciferase family)